MFSILPAAGRWTTLARLLAPDEFGSSTFTLPGGIRLLWTEGEPALALLVGLLSLVLPAAKLTLLWWEIHQLSELPAALVRFFRIVASYAMVEVFLIAILVVLVKGMPGGSDVRIHAGTWLFTASVLLSLMAARIAASREPLTTAS
jgi:paraquat-inducible protein A